MLYSTRSTLVSGIKDGIPDIENPALTEYHLYRSKGSDDELDDPECIVGVSFEVDDTEQGRHLVDSLFQISPELPPGYLSVNFHLSTDGSRVLNFAEWVSEEAHREMLAGDRNTDANEVSQRIDDMPGVRGLGFKRYRLFQRLVNR